MIISVLGGSKVQIGGPTGAFIVIIYGIIQRSHKEGITIILSGVTNHVHKQLLQGGIEQQMNPNNICSNIHVALNRANQLLTH